MPRFVPSSRLAVTLGLLLIGAGTSRADRLRVHYGPADGTGQVAPAPSAEYVSRFGSTVTPVQPKIVPNRIATFVHPYTGRQVQVPIAFPPDSTPQIQYRGNWVIFNYGSYTIEVVFLPDGSVDVVYNSGFLRPLG